MERILKVFATGAEQDAIATHPGVEMVARYDGFVVTRTPQATADVLAAAYPVEDISEQFAITYAGRSVGPGPTGPTPMLSTSVKKKAGGKKAGAKGAAAAVPGVEAGKHHYVLQFVGPIKPEWLKAVGKAGGELREPRDGFAYIVRADADDIPALRALPCVRWLGRLPHESRIAATLAGPRSKKPKSGGRAEPVLPRRKVLPGALVVEFFGKDDLKKGLKALRALDLDVASSDEKSKTAVVLLKTAAPPVDAISKVHGVKLVRERTLPRTANDVAATFIYPSHAAFQPPHDFSGRGEVIAVCDTGLDTGDPSAIHEDFRGRVAHVKSWAMTADYAPYVLNPGANDGASDTDSGHGTHVAGSVLGNGAVSRAIAGLKPIRGLAHRARLIFQAIEQEMRWRNPADYQQHGRFLLSGIPAHLGDLFTHAYERRARIHTNSWGGGDPGAYDSQCEAVDRFVWDHKDFTILFAAGNDGTDSDGDGQINLSSVTSPGTAKNCITVGACENLRPNFAGQRYGAWWPGDYPVAPFRDDAMADDPETVVAFSSRGPAEGNRVKPDVVAPGTFILSTRSTRLAQNAMAWGAFPPSRMYFHMGGTSMATPLTAGAVALLREYFRRKQGVPRPTAALLKAALIASAVRLRNAGNQNLIVDNHQGFGRVNLDNVLHPTAPSSVRFAEVKPGLTTGKVDRRTVLVRSSNAPLRIVLAYSDYPGPALVNNLNLIVTAPDGRRHVGNVAAGAALTLDGANNVEVVHVVNPRAGDWKIEVVGSNVPHGPQDFALVCLGHF